MESPRSKLNKLSARPDKYKLHEFFYCLVSEVEKLKNEIEAMKAQAQKPDAIIHKEIVNG